jgi:signal transduction histidine kinase
METVERLKELDHLKSAFLANMSHELRTPLNSILGFTQVIIEGIDGPVTEEMGTDLGLIEKNSKHLLALINDVLDMAKIEAGRVSLALEAVKLTRLLDDVIKTMSSLAQEKSLYLRLESHLKPGMTLLIDSVRIRQVVINLIGNAVKFTKQGGITLRADQDEDEVHIQVIDTGIGVPAEKLESIFEAFSQVDTSTTRQTGGTGLGLPISRRLVELHGGSLWAESEGIEGEGSIFHLQLPIKTDEEID